MTATKITNEDRAATVRDGWRRAYGLAIAACEPVRLHLGEAFRAAWAAFRQARAEGSVVAEQTAAYEEQYGRSDRAEARAYLKAMLVEKAAQKAAAVEDHWSTFGPAAGVSLDEDDFVCDLDEPTLPAPAAVDARGVMRGIILKRLDLNGAVMTRLLEERDSDVALYGLSSLTDRAHERLDNLHTDGVNLRGALADIDLGGIALVPAGQHADAAHIAELRARDAHLTREIDGLAAAAQAWVEGRDVPGAGDAVPTFDRLWEEREWLRVRINADESAAVAKARAPVQLGFEGMLVPARASQQATLKQTPRIQPIL